MNLEEKITDLSLEITTTNYKTGQNALHSKKVKRKKFIQTQQNTLAWKQHLHHLHQLVGDAGQSCRHGRVPRGRWHERRPEALNFRTVLRAGQVRELQEFACRFSGLKGWSSLLLGREPGSGVGEKDQHCISGIFLHVEQFEYII